MTLYFNRARYLNAVTGRFWSQDAFEGNLDETASLHKYNYTRNNPLNRIDPTGFKDIVELLAVAGVYGILAALFLTQPVGVTNPYRISAKAIEVEDKVRISLMGSVPGATAFAQGAKLAADLFFESEEPIDSTIYKRSAYIGILQDMFMSDESIEYIKGFFGLFGYDGPRNLGLPEWIKDHTEGPLDGKGRPGPGYDWFICSGDVEKAPTGRRDHFLANAQLTLIGHVVFGAAYSGSSGESSCGDLETNAFGFEFGWLVKSGGIKKNEISSFIYSRLGPWNRPYGY